MRIAVDGRSFSHPDGGFEQYLLDIIQALSEDHPSDEFNIIVDTRREYSLARKNLKTTYLPPGKLGKLSRYWWERIRLPKLLKTLGASVLIQPAKSKLLKLQIPVVLVVPDVDAIIQNKVLAKKGMNALSVVVFSTPAEATCKQYYGEATTTILPAGAPSHFAPVEWEEKEHIKQQFADGFEYFLFFASGNSAKTDLLNVLKAFSLFKLRQRTNMKLVIHGFGPDEPLEELKRYKFREGVRVVGPLASEQRAKLIAGAYAFLPAGKRLMVPMIEALHCGVPVLTPATDEAVELLGSAMLATPLQDPADIAAQLKRIFLDEDLRSRLVSAAADRAHALSWNNTRQKMWEVISKAVLQ
ncbi:glycosyltransferase [Segetibacter sp. 3557_3]|uniref:glycosyltransferase n=1 Tax=Segetibacter sp. 3557_3 TaxID=2547429 RepID=UPI0010590623|nr:glycosyltransferase [Segetibacter sp. 3557_3]TDH23245.1 glycosyltransferase [Segetibacter sp. 3557_3]